MLCRGRGYHYCPHRRGSGETLSECAFSRIGNGGRCRRHRDGGGVSGGGDGDGGDGNGVRDHRRVRVCVLFVIWMI